MNAVQKLVDDLNRERDYGIPGDRDHSDAIDTIATRMAADFDVAELLQDLHGDGYTAGALDRLMCGRRPMPGDASCLQTLLRRLRGLDDEVEREMQS